MLFLAAAAPALAAPPPAPAASPAASVPLHAGDTVTFDLSGLPERFEGEAKATCLGTRIAATGPVEARCERAFRFEVSPGDARLTFVFRGVAAAGGRERRIDLPILRAKKPVTFVAPSDGALTQPSPTVLPAEVSEKAARAAAATQCGSCVGTGFQLDAVKVTRSPLPPGGDLPVRIGITPAPPASPAPAR